MRHKIGQVFMFLGTALIVGALALFLWNNNESNDAEDYVLEVLPQIHQKVLEARPELQRNGSSDSSMEGYLMSGEPLSESQEETINETDPYDIIMNTPVEYLTEEDLKMTEVIINGRSYIGYLSIPDLNLELPVMNNWSYSQLRISPCRYTGSVRGKNLVVLAHNYKSHFGNISKLQLGAEIYFTDMDGNVWSYEVVAKDVLDPYNVEEMTAGEYDLTLFTCTPGGSYRVTVRCMQL